MLNVELVKPDCFTWKEEILVQSVFIDVIILYPNSLSWSAREPSKALEIFLSLSHIYQKKCNFPMKMDIVSRDCAFAIATLQILWTFLLYSWPLTRQTHNVYLFLPDQLRNSPGLTIKTGGFGSSLAVKTQLKMSWPDWPTDGWRNERTDIKR